MPSYSGIWSLSQQFQGRGQGLWPQPPGAPTIGTAAALNASASITFTASACAGVPAPITGYTATSTPGCVTGTAASSPITVSGLTNGTAYTFKVKAQNGAGFGACSAASNSVTPSVNGQQAYTTAGTFSWVAPAGVTSVSVVAVGGGSSQFSGQRPGAGGGLGYKNNISVTSGSSYTVVVGAGVAACTTASGGDSYFNTLATVKGGGALVCAGGTFTGDGGGVGGGAPFGTYKGGGAGGYAGSGGTGTGCYGSGTAGSGGGGGSGGMGVEFCYAQGASGGGVGILGQGSNGAGGTGGVSVTPTGGGGGSGGTNGNYIGAAGAYGGGAGMRFTSGGLARSGGSGVGAVRIIWPGNTRSFPSTNTGDL